MSEQSQLIQALIESNKSTLEKVDKLCDSVDHLVQIEARREERDKHQEEFNEDVKRFIDKFYESYRPSIERSISNQATIDKVKVPIISAIFLGILVLLGFDLGK